MAFVVLEYFGLDSLEPEVWIELAEPKSPSVNDTMAGEIEANRSRDLLGMHQSLSMVKSDQGDPLGLNDVSYK